MVQRRSLQCKVFLLRASEQFVRSISDVISSEHTAVNVSSASSYLDASQPQNLLHCCGQTLVFSVCVCVREQCVSAVYQGSAEAHAGKMRQSAMAAQVCCEE